MPLAPVVATQLTTPEQRSMSVHIGSRDVTGDTKWDTLVATDSGVGARGTLNLRLTRMLARLPEVTDQALVRVIDHGAAEGDSFRGFVRARRPIRVPGLAETEIIADDIGGLLDDAFIPHEARPAESMQARLGFLWGRYASPPLSGDFTKVAAIGGTLPAQDFSGVSLRQAIEATIAQASTDAAYYIDGLGKLHVFTAESNDAPIEIADPLVIDGVRRLVADESAGSIYLAFPGVTRAANGDVLVVYSRLPDHHDTTHVGTVEQKRSTDGGVTFGAATTVVAAPTPGTIGASGGPIKAIANGNVLLGYETRDGNDTLDGRKTFLKTSTDHGATYGAGVQITTHGFTTYVVPSAPIVQLANGDLLWAFYGKSGSTFAVKILRSTDNGASWAVLSTVASSDVQIWTEPTLVQFAGSNDLMVLLREESGSGIYRSRSTDSGATWTTPVLAFAGRTHPITVELNNGALLYVSRANPNGGTVYRVSLDDGDTWTDEINVDVTGQRSLYAGILPNTTGALVVYSQEITDSNADVFAIDFSTEHAPHDLSIDYDSNAYANTVYVQAATPEASGYFTDHAALADANNVRRVVTFQAPDCETLPMSRALGLMYLGRVARGTPRGSFSVTGIDGWRAGQNVRVHSAYLNLAETFRIARVTTRVVRPGTALLRSYRVEFGGSRAGGSARGAGAGSASGQLVSGNLGGQSNTFVTADGVQVTDGQNPRVIMGRLGTVTVDPVTGLVSGEFGLRVMGVGGSTVIIDGTSNMFKIAATGTLSSASGPNVGRMEISVDLATGLTTAPMHTGSAGFGYGLLPYMLLANESTGDMTLLDLIHQHTSVVNTDQTRVTAKYVSSANRSTQNWSVKYYVYKEAAV